MNDLMQPLIHKTALREIAVHIARTGLSIGTPVVLHALPDGRIGAFVRVSRRLLGLIPREVTLMIGILGPNAGASLAGAVARYEPLRVRIVGLTPEHLTQPGQGPEIHISVWGDPRRLGGGLADGAQPAAPLAGGA